MPILRTTPLVVLTQVMPPLIEESGTVLFLLATVAILTMVMLSPLRNLLWIRGLERERRTLRQLETLVPTPPCTRGLDRQGTWQSTLLIVVSLLLSLGVADVFA